MKRPAFNKLSLDPSILGTTWSVSSLGSLLNPEDEVPDRSCLGSTLDASPMPSIWCTNAFRWEDEVTP